MSAKKNLAGDGVGGVSVDRARKMHEIMLARAMTGPGDSEGAMHRLQAMFGLDYWQQHNLRYQRRGSISFRQRVRQSYFACLEWSVRRDLANLQNEQELDAAVDRLKAEAESLLAQIAAKRVGAA